jgi:hypothetical protein
MAQTCDIEKERRWIRTVQEQLRSGWTVRRFCRQYRIPEPRFYRWRRELLRRRKLTVKAPRAGTEGLSFTPVGILRPGGACLATKAGGPSLEAASTQPHIEVVLRNGRQIGVRPGFDGPTLIHVVRVLEERPC